MGQKESHQVSPLEKAFVAEFFLTHAKRDQSKREYDIDTQLTLIDIIVLGLLLIYSLTIS